MQGLNTQTFWRLAHKLAHESKDSEQNEGFFESGEGEVRYIPKAYLLRKAKRAVKAVALGTEPYGDLQKLSQRYLTLLPDVEAAKHFVETECLHKDGSPYKWTFVSHYVIGELSLNNTAQRCFEVLGPQRYLDTKVGSSSSYFKVVKATGSN